MNLSSIPPLISALLYGFLGGYCFFKNPRSNTNKAFALLCLTTVWWQGSWTILFNIKDPKIASILVKIGYSGIIFIPITFYHFIIEFFNQAKEKRLVYLSYILGIIFLTTLWKTNYFIKGHYSYPWGYYPKASPVLHPVYLFILSSQVFRMYWLLIIYLKKKQLKSIRHNQIKYVLWALFFYTFAAADFATNYGVPQYPLGFFPIIISFAIISYSIAAYRLMDINIVIRKTIVYSLLASSIAVIFTLTTVFFEHIFKQTIGYKTFSGTLLVALLIAFFFQPLYRWLSSIADKLFFKGTLPQIAEELHHAEKLASLGVLASGLAHEIKNPLAPIKTYIQNLPKNLSNPNFIEKITKIIPDEVDKITDIINQLRDFANPPPLNLTTVNIHNLIDKRLNLLEQDLAEKNITVERHYSPTLQEINADPIQLEMVFINLFLNAIDALPNGGKLIVATEQSNNQALIKISDTGTGIPKEDLPHIFDPFYSKGKHKGIGLGLAIVHRIIKEHGGVIKVENCPEGGAIFCISLPCYPKNVYA